MDDAQAASADAEPEIQTPRHVYFEYTPREAAAEASTHGRSGRPAIVPAIALPPRVPPAGPQLAIHSGDRAVTQPDDALSVSSDSVDGDSDLDGRRQSPQALDAITWRQRLAALRPLLAGEVSPGTFLLQPSSGSSNVAAAGAASASRPAAMQASITPQSTPRGLHDSVDSGPESAEEINTRLDEANARIANMLMQTRAAASEVLSISLPSCVLFVVAVCF